MGERAARPLLEDPLDAVRWLGDIPAVLEGDDAAAKRRRLDRLGEQMAAAADGLYEVVTAAENAMHATGNGHGT